MLFNSYLFLLMFLPLTIVGYYVLKYLKWGETAKVFLIVMSLWFCGYYNIVYVYAIGGSIAGNFIFHRILLRKNDSNKKNWLILAVLLNVAALFYVKYFNFFLENINSVFQLNFTLKTILLPLGISFFTFQQIAFLVDTYRGEVEKETLLDYILFVTFFPKLIQGPIPFHKELSPQFKEMHRLAFDKDLFYKGLCFFTLGLGKKILIADKLGTAVDWGYTYTGSLDSVNALIIILCYSLQLYFDFSGYCDMARGLGYFFGITLPINFLSPFKSHNIVEFWKRWHITLGRFFTKYVYIPLGGNRKGKGRTYLNIMIVFLLSGLWHGANWTFILWGVLHGGLNALTRVWQELKIKFQIKPSEKPLIRKILSGICIMLTFVFVVMAFGIFRADSIEQAKQLYQILLNFKFTPVFHEITDFLTFTEFEYGLKLLPFGSSLLASTVGSKLCGSVFFVVVLAMVFGCKNLYEKEEQMKPGFMLTTALAIVFLWSLVSISQVSTFLYFNF